MAKRTLWNWLFGLMAKTEHSRPMAAPNNPPRKEALSEDQAKALQDEWNEICSRGAPPVGSARHSAILAGQGGLARKGDFSEFYLRMVNEQIEKDRQEYWRKFEGKLAEGKPVKWEPGIEHSQPHPVKENPDGSLYYKGKVYRMVGERRNNKNKCRQG